MQSGADELPYMTSATRQAVAAAAITRVEAALLWKDPWLSLQALGGGLYLIVCAQQVMQGAHMHVCKCMCVQMHVCVHMQAQYTVSIQ